VSIVGPTEARPDDGLVVDFVVESDRAQPSRIVRQILRSRSEYLQLVGLKPAADGHGIIVRLQEIGGQASSFVLRFSLTRVVSAKICDMLEISQSADDQIFSALHVSGHIGANQLQTIRVILPR
jgi:hypothetical protein